MAARLGALYAQYPGWFKLAAVLVLSAIAIGKCDTPHQNFP